MKTMIAILTLTFSMSAMAGITLKSTRGHYTETYAKIKSHGIIFSCLAVETTDQEWDVSEKEREAGVVLLRVLNKKMKIHIENQKNNDSSFCKKFQGMKDDRLALQREELRQMADNMVVRLFDASNKSTLEEIASSSKTDMITCVNDLVNVAQLTQIEKACL